MTEAEQELADKIDEIVHLLDKVRVRDGPRAPDFMMWLGAGIVIGKLQAELKRR